MIRVLHIKPNEEPIEVFIEDSLEEMQKLVGDDHPTIDRLSIDGPMAAIFFDDDGIRKELVPNRWYEGHHLLGPLFISRQNEDGEMIDLTDKDVDRWKKKFALSQSRLR